MCVFVFIFWSTHITFSIFSLEFFVLSFCFRLFVSVVIGCCEPLSVFTFKVVFAVFFMYNVMCVDERKQSVVVVE